VREVLGDDRRQSEQSRLEFGLGLSHGFLPKNDLDRGRTSRRREAPSKAAHRKLDQSRVYFCGVGLRERDGGSNRKWCGGSDDVFPFSNQTQSDPNLAWAFPSAGEMTLLTESRLSAFTVMIRFITSSDVMCSDLWGKEARNNSAILRAWDGLSQFRTMTVKILEIVEFIEALESVDGMCAARQSSVNQKRF